MTSQGIGEPFAPSEVIKGYQACEMSGSVYIGVNEDAKSVEEYPEVLMNISAGDEVMFRYVKSEQEWKEIEILYSGAGKIQVYMNEKIVGTINCDKVQGVNVAKASIKCSSGQYELKLRFESAEQIKIYQVIVR